jgi:antitoxin HicB
MPTMRTLSYRITLKKEPEGGYTVLVPALPGCVTFGKTLKEAIEMSRDAITGYVESLIEDGEIVPVEDDLIISPP